MAWFILHTMSVLHNSDVHNADVIIYVVEDTSRWRLDKVSEQVILERRVPIVFLDPHDYYWLDKTDNEIAEQSFFLSPRRGELHPGYPLKDAIDFHTQVVSLGIPTNYFKLWKFDKEIDRVHPLVPCLTTVYEEQSYEEFSRRLIDITLVATQCPPREAACDMVTASGIPCRMQLYPQYRPYLLNQWVDIHRQSKTFMETGAGTPASARPVELGTLSLMVKQRDRVSWPEPFKWVHNESCIEVGKPNVRLHTDDLAELKELLKDTPRVYKLYKECRQVTMRFTPSNIATYVRGILTDWLGIP